MGLFDKFTQGSESDPSESQSHGGEERDTRFTDSDNYQADSYSWEEMSDEISIIFADRWPTGKAPANYELVYGVDPNLPDPLLLKCANQFFMPKGTKLLPFEDLNGVSIEGKTYWVTTAQLITPELASFIDYDWDYKAPEAMEGRRIAPQEPDEDESEFIQLLLSSRQATREA